ncbi:hypothetical protein J7I98_03110 [Streptomyces sp. ISL-98]|uniref:hypothetical protein n=1 Tax=Streptomyces sp. ISL-98 TaxID=2819192 RepID=UPI001BEA858B|nr:hypothetical protein [Streptomyces sp. ISL-98]MBT2504901.1 hypothetical protein [Streptomyces sp. ISL-98]
MRTSTITGLLRSPASWTASAGRDGQAGAKLTSARRNFGSPLSAVRRTRPGTTPMPTPRAGRPELGPDHARGDRPLISPLPAAPGPAIASVPEKIRIEEQQP